MRFHRRWASLLGIGLTLALSSGNVPSAQGQGTDAADLGASRRVAGVVFAQGTLSVDVQDEDFGMMFRDIAARAQIEISNLDGLPARRISIRFTGLSLMEGIKRLLRVAGVPGYALITAQTENGVKVERILFMDASGNAGVRPRAAAPPRVTRRSRRVAARSERARSRTAARNLRANDNASTSVFEDLKANPKTNRLLNQLAQPDEQVRERAIEALMQLAGDTNKRRDLIEALEPYLNDLRHGDEEAREEAQADIRSMLSR